MTDERLSAARDPEQFRELGHEVIDRLADHLTAAGTRAIPVSHPLDPYGMSERWPAVVNGSGAIYELSQVGGACELALSKHLAARLCMPETSGGMIVSGGTIAT